MSAGHHKIEEVGEKGRHHVHIPGRSGWMMLSTLLPGPGSALPTLHRWLPKNKALQVDFG